MKPWEFRFASVEETYTAEAVALLVANPSWDLAKLERECALRGIAALREPSPVDELTQEAQRLGLYDK